MLASGGEVEGGDGWDGGSRYLGLPSTRVFLSLRSHRKYMFLSLNHIQLIFLRYKGMMLTADDADPARDPDRSLAATT